MADPTSRRRLLAGLTGVAGVGAAGALLAACCGSSATPTGSSPSLRGEYFTDTNLLAAASILVAIPTLIVFFVARRQLRRGLTLGAVRG